MESFKLPYPAIADVRDKIWDLYDCNTWPNSFLIDRSGIIRQVHQGEGNYGRLEREIQRLLSEEIYVGYLRGSIWGGEIANKEGFPHFITPCHAPDLGDGLR